MALTFTCANPAALLQHFINLIDEDQVKTWAYDEDGDFTHTPNQWIYHAWLRPVTGNNILTFNILGRTDSSLSVVDYAVYHGRFIESFLTHLDGEFSTVNATAMPINGDVI